ncbi:MAG: VOC family protein [Burkholderiales bacterium]
MDNDRREHVAPAACTLDHIVVIAPTLRSGVEWVRDALGVAPQPGGAHREMGTHNCLLRLGESAYLEVIAVDADAPAPDRPRWFGLDRLALDDAPRLAAWVARTADIRAAHSVCGEPLGGIERMSRGDLSWLITIPEDGSLPQAGAAPMLIEWATGTPHPATRLDDSRHELLQLQVFHAQPDRIAAVLDSIGFEGAVRMHPSPPDAPPCLLARIRTPNGIRVLGNALSG